MAGGSGGGRSLEETPTWAVATVCFVMILISIIIEHIFHLTGEWLKKKHKKALYESLEKIKSELMLLGFISLLLTVGQSPISRMCISEKVADSWHPCSKEEENNTDSSVSDEESEPESSGRRLLAAFVGSGREIPRRVLAGGGGSDKCGEGKVPFVSSNGINQLHIFIFVLACFHVVCCILTMALGRAKMRKWKRWEEETKTPEYQFSHDPERFRFARDTSFGRRHLSFWTQNPVLIWIVCFLRQFVWSVPKVDYLTLRHGFIMAHLSPQSHSKFDFRKYIKRSLDEDFKVVVGISPPLWFLAVLFLLFNTHGWNSYLWLPFIPLIIILVVGTKLQVIITKMGLSIHQRGEVLQGMPLVQPGDDLFWFHRPRLVLHLINFVFFQNAFQLAFLTWTALQFGIDSCFHSRKADVIIRMSMGVLVQILCSYVTLPLYALVTQMGSTMKASIFNERVAMALRNWHKTAKRNIKRNRVGSVTPMSSRGTTPTHPMSPVHLLRFYRSEIDSFPASPARRSNFDDTDSASASNSPHHQQIEMGDIIENNDGNEIVVSHSNKEFSFDKRTTIT